MRKTTINFYYIAFIVLMFQQSFVNAQTVIGSVMNEVFKQTTLVNQASGLNDPWEVTYGSDNFLWITVAKDYKILRMDPTTGAQTTVLDLSPTATGYLTATEHTNYNRLAWTNSGSVPWPQGGMMGLALHPQFMSGKPFVYLGYVRSQGSVPTNGTGQYYTNFLVRFTYNSGTGKLESPVTLCDTLPGSKDHNSGRIIIAPIGGVNYLLYSSGDMGSGQYENLTRPVKVQNINCYEGKILRFNLEEDVDAVQNIGVRSANYNRWIPNGAGAAGNPYNSYLGKQSAVWNMGHRNVQGFATANLGGSDIIYALSHGPYSDDELNIMEAGKNYGHPLVVGYSTDSNYNGAKAGPSTGSLPFIPSVRGELNNVDSINALPFGTGYKDPIYTFYPQPKGSTITCSAPNQNYIQDIYRNCAGTGTNNNWRSEAPSGLGIYTSSIIPGWKNSFLLASLKWGRVVRVKLNNSYNGLTNVDGVVDTVPYFESRNRYRDMAISNNGKDLFIIMDKSLSTSGPSQENPTTLNCTGCVVKYNFLGYNDVSGASSISTSIPIGTGIANTVTATTETIINTDNNNLWVPITDSNGDIIAEIDANSNSLDTITSSVYINTGTVRTSVSGKPYLDRSITIKPKFPIPGGQSANVRLYLKASELAALIAAPGSGVSGINDINIFKNSDANGSALTATPSYIVPLSRTAFGSGYVIKVNITGFSTFYFAGGTSILPLKLITFSGLYQNSISILNWQTESELNTENFIVERRNGNGVFEAIGTVDANGNTNTKTDYQYLDKTAGSLNAQIIYYRLKMVDKDGRYNYSSIVAISILDLTTTSVTIYPNPVKGEAVVSVTTELDAKISWQLIDNTGRVLINKNTMLRSGINNISVDLSNFSTGTYFIKLTGENINEVKKLQKQ